MASKLTLTFTGKGILDESIDVTGTGLIETFAKTRFQSKQVTIAESGVITEQIKYWVNAFHLDYNRENEYAITTDATTVSIEHFDNDHFDSFVDGTHNLASNITTALTTDAQRVVITITNTPSESTESDKCGRVQLTIGFSVNLKEVQAQQLVPSLGVQTLFDDDNLNDDEIVVQAYRSSNPVYLTMSINGSEDVFDFVFAPLGFVIIDVITTITSSGGSATINIFEGAEGGLAAVFGIQLSSNTGQPIYNNSNIFTGLSSGDYTAFAKDIFGCIREKEFRIGAANESSTFEIPDYFYFSGKNSVRMVNRIIDENQLSANNYNFVTPEMPELINEVEWTQKYSASQIFRMQFKSSFLEHRVRAYFCLPDTGVQFIDIPFSKKSDNIRRDVYLEGITTWDADLGRLLISFAGGDIYASANGLIVKGQHTFNQYLPLYYEVGIEIVLNGVQGTIVDIITEGGVDYAVTSFFLNNPEASTVIHSIHVALPYEVFHFDIELKTIREWFDTHYEDDTNEDNLIPEPSINPFAARKRKFWIEVLFRNEDALNKSEDRPWKGKYISDYIEQIRDSELTNGKYHIMQFGSEVSDAEIDYTIYTEGNPLAQRKAAHPERITHLRNIPYFTGMKRVSSAELDTQKLDSKIVKIDYKSMKVYALNLSPLPPEYAGQLMDSLDNSGFIIIDGMLVTTIEAAEISHRGHLTTVGANLAVVNNSDESDVLSTTQGNKGNEGAATGFYPVVT